MNPAMMMAIPSVLALISGLTGDKAKQGSTYNKGQLQGLDQLIQSIKGGMGGPQQDITQQQGFQQGNDFFNSLFNDPEFFNKFEAPAMRQFDELQGDIGNRFAGMGSGSTGSTGFRNVMAREGQNLSSNLAAQRGQMQQGAIPQMLGYAQQPVSNWMTQMQQAFQPTQNQYTPAAPGFGGNIASSMFGGLSQGYGNAMGNQMSNWLS
jgi:hypothetical protein